MRWWGSLAVWGSVRREIVFLQRKGGDTVFIFSVKTSKKQLISLVICGVMLLAVVVMMLCLPQKNGLADAPDGGTAADRVAFLGSLGYEVSVTSEQSETVTLPSTFDEVLTDYNTLQQAAGMDLRPFSGRVLWRYTYDVTNYADEPLAQAHLYVWNGWIVGGDIASTARNGFMHGLLPHDG